MTDLSTTQTNTFNWTGQIVTVTVGTTGWYDVTADGGQGGNANGFSGGFGAMANGVIFLQAGAELEIVVGGVGGYGGNPGWGGGGGGGSFVIMTANPNPLATPVDEVIAGGGGGAAEFRGGDGRAGPTGGAGGSGGGGGGVNGAPGQGAKNSVGNGAGGGGFTGGAGGAPGQNGSDGGGSFAGGAAGTGGQGAVGSTPAGAGGFGGGGGGVYGEGVTGGGGGGGGYGGGGGGTSNGLGFDGGGGGGSYVNPFTVAGISSTVAGVQQGNGLVTIEYEQLLPATTTVSAGDEGGIKASVLTAAFIDFNTSDTTSDFSGTINWGDSTTTPFDSSSVTGSNGNFSVSGLHPYAEAGNYNVSVVINNVDGTTTTDTATAAVSDVILNFGSSGTATLSGGTEGGTAATLTAPFTDLNTEAPPTDFTATINWGDGTTEMAAATPLFAPPFPLTGLIAGSDGSYTVSDSHIYAGAGHYTVTVTINDRGGATTTDTGTATIAGSPLTAGTATLTGGVEGTTATTLSATFSDANTSAPTTDFSGTIAWGDGLTTTFDSTAVSGSGGSYTVNSSHTYAEAGAYAATVTINDVGNSTSDTSNTVTVADAPLTALGAKGAGGDAGTTPTELIAEFTDAKLNAPASDFSGTIDWGDGNTTPFTSSDVTALNDGKTFGVDGTHQYTQQGTYNLSVVVDDIGGATTELTGTATVAATPLTAGTATLTDGVEGVTVTALSATFSAANVNAQTSDFSGTIAWGDGDTTPFTSSVVSGSGGAYTVSGSHQYAAEGTYSATVTINDGSGNSISERGTATVGDAPLTHGTATLTGGVEGVTATTLSATFSDANTGAPTGDFSGTINWGDGQTTTFDSTAVSGSNGSYTVSGSHQYANEGSYTTTVTINDEGGSSATDSGAASVASDLPVVTALASTVNASASETFTPAQLFSASDAEGAPILGYEVQDESSGSSSQGFWVLNGAVLPNGQTTTLTTAQLSKLSFKAGSASTPVSDTLEVAASDAAGFGAFTTFTVTASAHASTAAPTVTAANELQGPNLTLTPANLFSAAAFGGNNVTSYEVEDTTADSGHWVFNSVVEPANQPIDVTATQLSELSFSTGYGSDTLKVRANDGSQWSNFASFTVTPPPNAAPPAATASTLIMERQADGALELYNIGRNTIQLDGPLGQIDPTLQVAGVGGFDGSDTTDLLMRNPTTGAFTLYDVSNNNITGNVTLGQVGTEWQVAGFGDFSGHAGETDMLMRDSNTGAFEVYDISNNAITSAAGMGQVGTEWQVAGFGDFSGHANETDMLMRSSNTGAFEVYDIANNSITSAAPMGQVGLEWSVAGFGDFSGRAGETDMLMRNSNTGAFEVYDISHSAITASAAMGQVGLEWQIAGLGDFSGNANETDMLMRNSNTGAFELYDISNNTITLATGMGQVGLEWSVDGISTGGASSPPRAQLSGIAVDPANTTPSSATSQLTQAMAAFAPSAGTTATASLAQAPGPEASNTTSLMAVTNHPQPIS